MRPEEPQAPDNVLAFRRRRETTGPAHEPEAAPDAAPPVATSPATVLNAERGIINTGTVHGGQHVTTVGLSGHTDGGTDGDS